jgi:hypothetical protein
MLWREPYAGYILKKPWGFEVRRETFTSQFPFKRPLEDVWAETEFYRANERDHE